MNYIVVNNETGEQEGGTFTTMGEAKAFAHKMNTWVEEYLYVAISKRSSVWSC